MQRCLQRLETIKTRLNEFLVLYKSFWLVQNKLAYIAGLWGPISVEQILKWKTTKHEGNEGKTLISLHRLTSTLTALAWHSGEARKQKFQELNTWSSVPPCLCSFIDFVQDNLQPADERSAFCWAAWFECVKFDFRGLMLSGVSQLSSLIALCRFFSAAENGMVSLKWSTTFVVSSLIMPVEREMTYLTKYFKLLGLNSWVFQRFDRNLQHFILRAWKMCLWGTEINI